MGARARAAGERRSYQLFLAADDRGVCDQLRDWADADPRFRLTIFRTGWQLLRRVAYETPDLVLCDLALPGIDGMTVLRQLGRPAPPVVMLSPQTQEGARATTEALLAGAADYFIKKRRNGRIHIAMTSAALRRRLLDLLVRAGDGGAAGRDDGWLRFSPQNGSATWTPCAPQAAFPAHGGWTGFVLATPPSTGNLLRSLAAAPERCGGPIILQVCQPLCYSHALAETATRHWNRLVLEFAENEVLRAGQWRVLPGRTLLAPGRMLGEGQQWHRISNRICDPEASVRRQIALLGGSSESLRLYLLEPPSEDATAMLQSLADRGHAVLAYAGGLTLAAPSERGAPHCAAHHDTVWEEKPTLMLELGTNLRRTR